MGGAEDMKIKTISIWALFAAAVTFVAGAIIPIITLNSFTSQNGAIGIIGGADAPTYRYLIFSSLDGIPFVLILLGVTVFISAAFCLLFSRTVIKHCNIKTSSISLALSAVGGLGSVCALNCFFISAFGEVSNHPIEYPVSLLVGIICFFVFIALFGIYFIFRVKAMSALGILIDFLTAVIYLPMFFFAFECMYSIVC